MTKTLMNFNSYYILLLMVVLRFVYSDFSFHLAYGQLYKKSIFNLHVIKTRSSICMRANIELILLYQFEMVSIQIWTWYFYSIDYCVQWKTSFQCFSISLLERKWPERLLWSNHSPITIISLYAIHHMLSWSRLYKANDTIIIIWIMIDYSICSLFLSCYASFHQT